MADSTARLFVALLLEAPLLDHAASVVRRLRAVDVGNDVRWARPETMHVTLQFLGPTALDRIEPLRQGLGEHLSALLAPRLGPGTAGGFPNLRRPRVLWLGLREDATVGAGQPSQPAAAASALSRLHAATQSATGALGWPRDRRPYRPHLTLGRVREDAGRQARLLPDRLLQAITADTQAGVDPVPHPCVALMQSHLSPRGARHEAVQTWDLAIGDG